MNLQHRAKFALCLVFVLLLTSFSTINAQSPGGMKRVASVEGITEYQLPNGLKVLLFSDPTKQTVTVNITFLVGSKHENYGETGMAHLLEHLVFKGTPKNPNIWQAFSQRGARWNGTTWFDRTNYYETLPASDENLEWALSLEADRMVNSNISKKDLESEFSVVRNEFEAGENNPVGVLFDKIMATAYQWHNYGNTTIGARSDIENMPIDRLQAFYRNYYQPDNSVLLVAGNFDEAKAAALVAKHFGSIPRPTRTLQKSYTDEPVQDGERQITIRRVGDTQHVMAGYHVPPGTHADYAAIDIAWQILGNTPAGRLHKSLVETKKASSIFGVSFQLKEPGYGVFDAEVRKEMSLDAARDALVQTIEGMAANPPTAEEVERARTNLLKEIELNFNDPERSGVELSEWVAQGDWRLLFVHRDRLKKVSAEEVRRVAANYLKPSNRTLAFFIPTEKPDRAEVPSVSEAEVTALVKDYKGGAPVVAGELFDASPANIESRTKRSTAGSLKTAFLPKENRGDTVFANLRLRFGDEKSLINRSTAGRFAAQMLLRGTTKRTRQQIQDEFDRLRARVQIFGDATGATVSIETVRQNLPAVMRLVAEVLREASFPENEFEQLRQEVLAQIESQKSEPMSVGFNAVDRHFSKYPKGDVRYAATLDEQIADAKSVTLAEAKQFHKDFYGATAGELAVVGDFDAQEIAALTGELFSGWKSPRPFTRVGREFQEIAAVNQNLETPDKENAFFVARIDFQVRDDNADYPALVLGNYLLGGAAKSRLIDRFRQKDGISYGAWSDFYASPFEPFGSLYAGAIYAPQNAEKLETAFREEVARLLKAGFTAQELAEAKSGWLQENKVSRSQDRELTRKMTDYLFFDRTLNWDAELERKIQALTAEQVVAAIRKYVTPDKITIIKAGDFVGAKAKTAGQK